MQLGNQRTNSLNKNNAAVKRNVKILVTGTRTDRALFCGPSDTVASSGLDSVYKHILEGEEIALRKLVKLRKELRKF